MSGEKELMPLVSVIETFVSHSMKQGEIANERMNKLADQQIELTKEVGKLVTIIRVSEHRHIEHSKGLERVSDQEKENRSCLENYKIANDERVMNLEKANILQQSETARSSNRWSDFDKRRATIVTGVLTSVLVAAILIFLGLK